MGSVLVSSFTTPSIHGLWHVLIQPGKTEHAMHITETSFKQAAKRLSASQSLSLSASQEALAQAFGFRGLDPLLKQLRKGDAARAQSAPTTETPTAVMAQVDPAFCCGLTYAQFSLLLKCLNLKRILDLPADHFDRGGYEGPVILNAVLAHIATTGPKTMTPREIAAALSLEALKARVLQSIERHASIEPEQWPHGERLLGRYMVHLPGFRFADIRRRSGETDELKDQHSFRVRDVLPMLDVLDPFADGDHLGQLLVWTGDTKDRGQVSLLDAMELVRSSRSMLLKEHMLEIAEAVHIESQRLLIL